MLLYVQVYTGRAVQTRPALCLCVRFPSMSPACSVSDPEQSSAGTQGSTQGAKVTRRFFEKDKTQKEKEIETQISMPQILEK